MAIEVDWSARVISIPRADMALVATVPFERRELDINALHLRLRELEADAGCMGYPETHRHNTIVTLGGTTFARLVEIINGYTISFENGAYAVSVVGGNSNVADVTNLNSVQLRSNNSAGVVVVGAAAASLTDARVADLWQRHGLDPSAPAVHTATSIRVPADGSSIDQTVTDVGGTVTVERQ